MTVWHGIDLKFELLMQGHNHAVRTIVWSHDFKWMISGDKGGFVKYWDANMAMSHNMQAHAEPVQELTFSPTDRK